MVTTMQQRQIMQILSWCVEDEEYFNFCLNFFRDELKKKKSYDELITASKKPKKLQLKLTELSNWECNNLYYALSQNKKARESNFDPFELETKAGAALEAHNFSKRMQPFGDLLQSLFSFSPGGLLDSILKTFNQIKIYFNPEISLNKEELESSKFSELFVEAASKFNKKYNKLYRNFIAKNYSNEQILYGYMKELCNEEAYTVTNHRLFRQVEAKILNIIGKSNLNEAETEDLIAARIEDNLIRVKEFCIEAYADQADFESYSNQIASVKNIIKDLVIKIKKQESALSDMGLNVTTETASAVKSQQLNLYKSIKNNKKKLYHFLLKTEAWRKCNILSPGKRPFSYDYLKDQFKKFPDQTTIVAIDSRNDEYGLSSYNFNPEVKNKGILKLFECSKPILKNHNNVQTELKKLQTEDVTNLICEYETFMDHIGLLEKRKNAMLNFLENSEAMKEMHNEAITAKIAEITGDLAVILELKGSFNAAMDIFKDDENVQKLLDDNNHEPVLSSDFAKLKKSEPYNKLIKLLDKHKKRINEPYLSAIDEDLPKEREGFNNRPSVNI